MKRKHKVQLLTLVFFPLVFIIPWYLLTYQAIPVTRLIQFASWLFCFLFLVYLFLPRGRSIIGNQTASKKRSTLWWIIAIMALQIGFLSLFFLQNSVIANDLLNNNPTAMLHLYLKTGNLFLGPFIFFPWTIIAVVAVNFAYLSYHRKAETPFSETVPPRWPTVFSSTMIRRMIDLYVRYGTQCFLYTNIIFSVFVLYQYLFPQAEYFTLFSSLIVTMIFIILFAFKRSRQLIHLIETKQWGSGIHLIIFYSLSTIMIGFLTGILTLMVLDHPFLMKTLLPPRLITISYPGIYITLYDLCWWLTAVPLLASLMIKISSGRKARSLLLASMILPIILYIVWIGITVLDGMWIFISPTLICIIATVAFVFLLALLLPKISTQLMWFGFLPVKSFQKSRRVSKILIWLISIMLIALTLMVGTIIMPFLIILNGIPLLFIFLLTLFYRSNRLNQ